LSVAADDQQNGASRSSCAAVFDKAAIFVSLCEIIERPAAQAFLFAPLRETFSQPASKAD
jgi:hypothetical protein